MNDGFFYYNKELNRNSEQCDHIPQSMRKTTFTEHHNNTFSVYMGIKKALKSLGRMCYFLQMR